MRVELQKATVYVAEGEVRFRIVDRKRRAALGYDPMVVTTSRRYLSKWNAYVGLARAYTRARCECEEGEPDVGLPPYSCRYHARPHEEVPMRNGTAQRGYGEKIHARLARYLRWLDQRELATQRALRLELDEAS